MLQTIHPQLIAISKELMDSVGSSVVGNKQSNIMSSYIMSGERPAILVGKQEGRAGITTIVNMGSFFLFEGDIKATDLINYEASLTQKHKMTMSKALAATIGETMRPLQMQIKNSK
jgi:hypothetical protein